uniref:Uncharacterized protein n=1 Tax=Rhizobium rhizogenes TaxID=359 RepID=A0A7S4ZT37_RHIRH|nr:hypothetical protein pC5.8a_47 [Rhizobium rhizogenes]QCL09792.1 hypothetical protein pC5.8b_301 [Rhizobium rhizogenes]
MILNPFVFKQLGIGRLNEQYSKRCGEDKERTLVPCEQIVIDGSWKDIFRGA